MTASRATSTSAVVWAGTVPPPGNVAPGRYACATDAEAPGAPARRGALWRWGRCRGTTWRVGRLASKRMGAARHGRRSGADVAAWRPGSGRTGRWTLLL